MSSPDRIPVAQRSFAERHELAGLFVLGILEEPDRSEFLEQLAQEPALQAEVFAWQDRLLPLSQLSPAQVPSPELWSRIEARLQRPSIAQSPRTALGLSGLIQWLAGSRGLTLAALALSLMLVGLLVRGLLPFLPGSPLDGPEPLQATSGEGSVRTLLTLVSPETQAPAWRIELEGPEDQPRLRLVPLADTLAMQAIPEQASLQFWTKADGWEGPVSLGLVRPGEPQTVAIDRIPPIAPNQLFELTLEPSAGSPIGRPTGPVLFIGRVARTAAS